ncbi:MAG: hypothetical protein MI922_13545, partial [Bacteroidales bacterium]|nr:hypothetical protein [Bacteroidales bacterium]
MKKSILNLKMFAAVAILATILSSCSEKEIITPGPEVYDHEISMAELKAGKYAGNLKHVIADVQIGLLDKKINSKKHVDNLLKGFQEMQVNGLRFPIYAENNRYNDIHDYFFNEAKKKGFKIFGNPVLHLGGKRIANGIQFDIHNQPSVKGKPEKTQRLINEVKAYANNYKCDWISPFCEDDKTGKTWTKDQINKIFNDLHGNINGAKLIGPCCWGIPASIDVLNKTSIRNKISVATTHNLGWNHDKWPDFIKAAKGKEVWDSETNYNPNHSSGKETRIKVA